MSCVGHLKGAQVRAVDGSEQEAVHAGTGDRWRVGREGRPVGRGVRLAAGARQRALRLTDDDGGGAARLVRVEEGRPVGGRIDGGHVEGCSRREVVGRGRRGGRGHVARAGAADHEHRAVWTRLQRHDGRARAGLSPPCRTGWWPKPKPNVLPGPKPAADAIAGSSNTATTAATAPAATLFRSDMCPGATPLDVALPDATLLGLLVVVAVVAVVEVVMVLLSPRALTGTGTHPGGRLDATRSRVLRAGGVVVGVELGRSVAEPTGCHHHAASAGQHHHGRRRQGDGRERVQVVGVRGAGFERGARRRPRYVLRNRNAAATRGKRMAPTQR